MKKYSNLYNVLDSNERNSDDEDAAPKPQSRKERQQETKNKRETYGVERGVEDHKNVIKAHDKKQKNDYGNDEKRPFDRKSGTGHQAYGGKPKKGGYGKGNVGKAEDDVEEVPETEENEKKVVAEKPEVEEIIDVASYLKNNGRSLGMKKDDAKESVIKVDDDNLVLVQPKKVETKNTQKKKKNEIGFVTVNNQVDFNGKPDYNNNKGRGGNKNGRYNNNKQFVKIDNNRFPQMK